MNKRLAIITPSYINSNERFKFAKKSLDSLLGSIEESYPMIVVDDIPNLQIPLLKKIPNFLHKQKGEQVYKQTGIELIRQNGKGSARATKKALEIAKKKKCEFVFIHLDDNVYLPILDQLLKDSISALDKDRDLMLTRLTASPILSKHCTQENGNLTNIQTSKNEISFSDIKLNPTRFNNFTLWSSYFHEKMINNYWPIAMWSSVYRIDFLEALLSNKDVDSLGEIELYYQKSENWKNLIKKYNGKLGYINMQFCGLEMQRNKNWEELINYPNNKVL